MPVARLVVAEVLADGHRSEDRTDYTSSEASLRCDSGTTEVPNASTLPTTNNVTWQHEFRIPSDVTSQLAM